VFSKKRLHAASRVIQNTSQVSDVKLIDHLLFSQLFCRKLKSSERLHCVDGCIVTEVSNDCGGFETSVTRHSFTSWMPGGFVLLLCSLLSLSVPLHCNFILLIFVSHSLHYQFRTSTWLHALFSTKLRYRSSPLLCCCLLCVQLECVSRRVETSGLLGNCEFLEFRRIQYYWFWVTKDLIVQVGVTHLPVFAQHWAIDRFTDV
jgi:hypothetical protein